MAKMSKDDRLAKLRAKLKTVDTGGPSKFMRFRQGRTTIRLLPEVGEMDFFFQPVGQHVFPDGRRVYCPSFTTEGEEKCPICEVVQQLYNAGDRDMAGQLRVRRKFWMNVVVRGKNSEEDVGPKIMVAGVTIFEPISSLFADPDYGDISDVEDGVDIVIKREGEGLKTEYEVIPRRNDSPLSDNPEKAKQWLDEAEDLSVVVLSDNPEEDDEIRGDAVLFVLPYDRIAREFNLSEILDGEYSAAESTSSDDDSDEEFDYDDEEEIEEEPEVLKEITKRQTARRRARTRR